jgi:hypothetical protein
MTRTPQALGLEPATLIAALELGALPFAPSDVGWVLLAAAVMLAVVMVIGLLGRRRRRRARSISAVQRGTSGP